MGGRGSSAVRNEATSENYIILSNEAEDEAFFEDSVRSWKNNLSNREEVDLGEYTMYTNDAVNKYLRDDTIQDYSEDELKSYVSNITSALDKFDLKENVTLYRAGDSSDIGREFKSFVSASTSQELAEKYLGTRANTLFVIQVQKGTGKGAYVAPISEVPEEREFLLNRNLKPRTINKATRKINGKSIQVVTIQV